MSQFKSLRETFRAIRRAAIFLLPVIILAFALTELDGGSIAQAQSGAPAVAAGAAELPSGALSQGGAQQPGFADVLFKMLPMFVMVFFIFYFMVIKPQQQKLKDQQTLLQSLKRGDTVVTSGGIIAKVAQVEQDAVQLEVAPNVKIRCEPGHVAKRFEKPAADDSQKDKASKNKDAA